MLLSIVIPAFNESEGIEEFHSRLLLPALKGRKLSYEVIYVNDGSSDNTLTKLSSLTAGDTPVRVINLSRNFGKEIATSAGLYYAKGNAVIVLDSDGQHPPELIAEFVRLWQKGAQVVVGVRTSNQKEGFVKKFGSKLFYRMVNAISNTKLIPRSTDYRLLDRVVVDEFLKFSERDRITRGIIDWLGFERAYIEFDAPARLAGQASYNTSQLVRLALNSFVSLSLKPLFFFGWIGVAIIILSTIFGLFILIEQLILNDPWALHYSGSVILGTFTAFMVGLLLISQAILATYISHIYAQAQGRPLFVINPRGSKNL